QLSMDSNNDVNHLAIKEVDNYVGKLTTRNQPMTIKSITTYFAKQPYGWLELDTTALLIQLFKAQEIKLQLSSSEVQLEDDQLFNYVTKRDYVDRVVVKKRERISPVLLKNVKDLSIELFGISALPTDEDGLKNRFNELLKEEKEKLTDLLANYRNTYYPGESILADGKKVIVSLLDISDTTIYYKKAREVRHELKNYTKDAKEIKVFFENQRDKCDEAKKRLTIFEDNRTYVTDKSINEIVEILGNIVHNSQPYDRI